MDEMLWWKGAEPQDSFVKQILQGPTSWLMFVSCIGFALPAVLHLLQPTGFEDYLAGCALLAVAISSPLCDALCVHSGVFDDGSKPSISSSENDGCGRAPHVRYQRAAVMLRSAPQHVEQQIEANSAQPLILAPDRWNNLTRGLDRFVCLFMVFPALLIFAIRRPPFPGRLLAMLACFAPAWAACVLGQHLRRLNPCGVQPRADGSGYVRERTFMYYEWLHELWHLILIVVLCANALWH